MSAPTTPFAGEARFIEKGNSERMELILILAGTFWMGSVLHDTKAKENEKPRHQVQLTNDFYIGKYPVTQKLWEESMGNNPSHMKGSSLPVGHVSWDDSIQFCNRLSKREGKEPVYNIENGVTICNWEAKGYRLLTEAEWRYAARAGEYHLYSGSDNINDVVWSAENSGRKPQIVGTKSANAFGVHDMTGNVLEWCWDWFDDNLYQSRANTGITADPRGPSSGSRRVYVGGGWFYEEERCRLSIRNGLSPSAKGSGTGLRIGISR